MIITLSVECMFPLNVDHRYVFGGYVGFRILYCLCSYLYTVKQKKEVIFGYNISKMSVNSCFSSMKFNIYLYQSLEKIRMVLFI